MTGKQDPRENKDTIRLWVNIAKIYYTDVYSVRSGFSSKQMAEKHRAEGEIMIEVVEAPQDRFKKA